MSTTRHTALDAVAALRERVDEVLAPGDEHWDDARAAWMALVDQHPAAVALPHDVDEVAAVVAVARHHGLRVAPQGTGHNAAPVGDLGDAILLRTDRLREVVIDPERRVARVGAGALWEDVTGPAGEHGLIAMHGSSPNVGVVGYTLGGGMSWLARSRGLAATHVTAIELVTAGGGILRVDDEHEPELFWALRGGGGDYGIVTALEFRLFPLVTAYAGWLIFPWERAEEVLTAWADWTRTAPEDMTTIGRILQLPDAPFVPEAMRGANLAVVEIAYTGDDLLLAEELIRPLRAMGPMMDTVGPMPAPAMVRLHQDPEPPTPSVGGHVLIDRLTPEVMREFVRLVGPGGGSLFLSSEIRHLGGAISRPAPGAGALSHIEAEGALFVIGVPTDGDQAMAMKREAKAVEAALSAFGHGRTYRNFVEEPAPASDFHGDATLARLRAVRERFDPTTRIQANHPIDREG